MKHILLPKASMDSTAGMQEAPEMTLGGCFYDYLRSVDGEIVGVRYWVIEPINFDQHPVYSQFLEDDRFVFGDGGDYVDIVFDERNAELLQGGQLMVDAVQEFGGESVLKYENRFAIAFALVE